MAKTTLIAPSSANKQITVDTARFIQTRDTLTSAYLHLSMSMDRMVKAYLEHTQVVIDGDASLNAGLLLAPLQAHNDTTQALQDMLQQSASASMPPAIIALGAATGEEDAAAGGKRKKRAYKRDPNAPKRPLTAYFRYLQENRHKISEELHEHPEKFHVDGKAGDLSKIATERWNALTKEEREPWHEAYRLAMEDWKAQNIAVGVNEAAAIGEGEDRLISAGIIPHGDGISDSSDGEAAAVPAKASKKTAATGKKSTGGAAATPATGTAKRTFSSIPSDPIATTTPAKISSPERKRKAAAEPEESNKKKRGRKSKADGEPATPAGAGAGATAATPATATATATETNEASKKKPRKEKKDETAATKKAADKKEDRKKKKTT